MIVRINQIDPARAEADAGWPAAPRVGGLRATWPLGTRAMEVLILSQDEHRQPLTDAFRQQQFRQMLPQVAVALRGPGELPVLRLDGPVTARELLPAWEHLAAADGRDRFAFSAAARLEIAEGDAIGSVRTAPGWPALVAALADRHLGLESNVRARLFLATDDHVPALLDAGEVDDPVWEHLLDVCPAVIAPTRGLRSIQIFSRAFDVPQVKQLVMQRLLAVARGEPAVPAQ
ncbi:MAG TPA: hypothetical protein VF796_09245 [Humisphaera sp.]